METVCKTCSMCVGAYASGMDRRRRKEGVDSTDLVEMMEWERNG